MLSVLLTWGQQPLSISGLVQDSGLNGVVGQRVWVNLYSNGSFVSQQLLVTSATGFYNYSVPAQPNAVMEVMTNDCNGTFFKNTYAATASDSSFVDTLRIICSGLPVQNCSSQLTQRTISGNQVGLWDGNFLNSIPNAEIRRSWVFGDGSGATTYNEDSVTHNYSAPGQYQASMIKNIIDTVNRIIYCEDTSYITFNIVPSTTYCNASFYPDSSSGGGSLIIYNNSSPAHNNPSYTTSYSWNFGDGGTSAQPFPTYTYAQAGIYEICLTVTSIDASQNICTDTYCDSLGLDTNGAILYKGAVAGFSLRVQNPTGTMGLKEKKSSKFKIYPNPTNDYVNVVLPSNSHNSEPLDWYIMDTSGRYYLQGAKSSEYESSVKINVKPLPNGIYHLYVKSGKEISITKLMVN